MGYADIYHHVQTEEYINSIIWVKLIIIKLYLSSKHKSPQRIYFLVYNERLKTIMYVEKENQ